MCFIVYSLMKYCFEVGKISPKTAKFNRLAGPALKIVKTFIYSAKK